MFAPRVPFRRGGRLIAAAAICLIGLVAPAFPQGMGGSSMANMPKFQAEPAGVRTPNYVPTGPQILVTDVKIVGATAVPENKVFSYIKTRAGRTYDPELIQADVRALAASGLFRDVRTYTDNRPEGALVVFQVFERPSMAYVKYIGNSLVSDKALAKQANLKEGDPVNTFALEEVRRKLEDFCRQQGLPDAEVTLLEGGRPGDKGVVFLIAEGEMQRMRAVNFIGNNLATSARLKTQILSKPGYFYYIGGTVERKKIDEDVDRLTAYYRSLGYFRARIGREVQTDESGKWVTLTFVIDEGPQFSVRNVVFAGNAKFSSEQLAASLDLKTGETFNQVRLMKDTRKLQDIYGSQGYAFADVKAEPRFLEEPGKLDLVYQISEGDVFRVGKIDVKIAGEGSHTRRTVVLNRLSLRPGDLVDTRELRASERRLKASQLFKMDPQQGIEPKVVVKPPDYSKLEEALAKDPNRPSGPSVRGQSPDEPRQFVQKPVIPVYDLEVEVTESEARALEQMQVLRRLPPTDEDVNLSSGNAP